MRVGLLATAFLFGSLLSATAWAEKHLRVALFAFPPAGANPFTGTSIPSILTLPAVFDGLTHLTREGELKPWLATSWQQEDLLTWRFDLRRDVMFSNGEPFDARAVAVAFGFLLSPAAVTVGAAREAEIIERVEARDPYTIFFITKRPSPILPRRLVATRFPATDHWQTLGPDRFANNPVGTGPFQVEDWTAGRIELTAFRESWRPPKVDRVSLLRLSEQASRVQALQSGAADIAVSLSADDRDAVALTGGTLIESRAAGIAGITFLTVREGPLQNTKVRQALNYAVDKQVIVDRLMGGATVVAGQPVTQETLGYDPSIKPYPYDPARAKALLAEAGYADGFPMVIEVTSGAGVNSDAYYTKVAADLRAVGIEAKLKTISTQLLVQRVYSGEWDGDAFAMSMDTMPTLDALGPFRLHSCLWTEPWYCDPDDTPLIRAAESEMDPKKRLSMVRDLLRRYHEDPPAIYMFQMVGFTGIAPHVRNFKSDFGVYNYHDVDITEPE